jgi:hypothetical protein
MSMPEAAMDQDGGVKARKHHVRPARKVFAVQTVAKALGMQTAS